MRQVPVIVQFRSLFPFLVGILVAIVCARLGVWQLDRADQKRVSQRRAQDGARELDVRNVAQLAGLHEWQRVRMTGEWVVGGTVLLDNRTHQKRAGFHVLTPLRLNGDRGVVIVNRGWIAGLGDYSRLPVPNTDTGAVTVSGRLRPPVSKGYSLADATQSGPVWQKVDLNQFEKALGAPVGRWVVQQDNDANDGLVRDWPTPDLGLDKHYGYAFQWFALATTSLALTIGFAWKRLRRQKTDGCT